MTAANIGNWQFLLGTNASPQVPTAIEEVYSISGVGVTNTLEDVTNFDSGSNMEYIAGLADGVEITIEANYLPAGTMQAAFMTAVDNGDTRVARATYTGASPNKTFSFSLVCLGYTVAPNPTGKNAITFSGKITGAVTRA